MQPPTMIKQVSRGIAKSDLELTVSDKVFSRFFAQENKSTNNFLCDNEKEKKHKRKKKVC